MLPLCAQAGSRFFKSKAALCPNQRCASSCASVNICAAFASAPFTNTSGGVVPAPWKREPRRGRRRTPIFARNVSHSSMKLHEHRVHPAHTCDTRRDDHCHERACVEDRMLLTVSPNWARPSRAATCARPASGAELAWLLSTRLRGAWRKDRVLAPSLDETLVLREHGVDHLVHHVLPVIADEAA